MTVNFFAALGGVIGLCFISNGQIIFGIALILLGFYLDWKIGAFTMIPELHEANKHLGLKSNYIGPKYKVKK